MAAQINGGAAASGTDVTLSEASENIGDTLSVALAQDGASPNAWVLDIDVQLSQGRYRLGTLNPPAPGGLEPASRIVGFATCPGARGWWVTARCPATGEVAWLTLESSKCCGGTPGVVPNIFTGT